LLLAALLVPAGNGVSTAVNGTPGLATGTGAATIASSAGTGKPAATIDQKNLQFVPTTVSVKVGDTVAFKNSDPVLHTVDINGTNVTGNMKDGDVTRWQTPAPGTYVLTCDYHPQMRATIIVMP
jgi:plastocyanin